MPKARGKQRTPRVVRNSTSQVTRNLWSVTYCTTFWSGGVCWITSFAISANPDLSGVVPAIAIRPAYRLDWSQALTKEFFIISKNLCLQVSITISSTVASLALTLRSNDEIKIVKGKPMTSISTIFEWTDALIIYMKAFNEYFPPRGWELVSYLEKNLLCFFLLS